MSADYLNISPNLTGNRNPFNYEKFEQVARDFQTAWLTLDQITQQLNLVDDESQDTFLEGLEVATRMAIEDYLGMSIFPTQYRVYYGNSGVTGTYVALDLPEISQNNGNQAGVVINSVGYWNGNMPAQFVTLPSSGYQYDSTGNRVIVFSLPQEVSTIMSNPVVVTYTTNANPLANYPVIQQAGLLLLTHLYNNRSDTTELNLKKIPFGVEQLLRPYKPLVM